MLIRTCEEGDVDEGKPAHSSRPDTALYMKWTRQEKMKRGVKGENMCLWEGGNVVLVGGSVDQRWRALLPSRCRGGGKGGEGSQGQI